MALDFVLEHNRPGLLVLAAFFSVASVLNLAASVWSVALKKPLGTILVRAKKSSVASFPAEQPHQPGMGRPRTYGDQVQLYEVFDHMQLFERIRCHVYGVIDDVSYLAANLLWKPTGECMRVVFALTSRAPIVLMGSDLEMPPVTAMALYCSRVRVETLCAMFKQLIGAFRYHLWSTRLPRHSRKPKKNRHLKRPTKQDVHQGQRCWEGCERVVRLAAIALGVLPLIALTFPLDVWGQCNTFLRTRSRHLPSERTVKDVVAQMVLEDFLAVAPSGTMQEMRARCLEDGNAVSDTRSSTEKKIA